MKKKFYPSSRKQVNSMAAINAICSINSQKGINLEPLPLVENEQVRRVYDGWVNVYANVGSANSLMQYSEFLNKRLSYQECASLACDDVINAAINAISNECVGKWGTITSVCDDLREYLEQRIKEIKLKETLRQAIVRSLVYGGCGIFFNLGGNQDLEKELIQSKEVVAKNNLLDLRVVEPYLFAPYFVNTTNPIADDFMKPNQWYVTGVDSSINSSRLWTLTFFDAPDMIKPLYNFLGISLCSFMKDKVRSADVIRQSLSDLFLRFKMDVIKTPAMQQTNEMAVRQRIELLNASKNNLGTLLLSENEDWIQTITSLSGLDKIQAQAYESIASSARMPAIKLLGLTPSGFNATGQFDLENYYDTIAGYQNSILKPFILRVLKILALEAKSDESPDFEFAPLEKDNNLEKSQIANLNADLVLKIIDAGIITQEQGLKILQSLRALDSSISYEAGEDLEGLDDGED